MLGVDVELTRVGDCADGLSLGGQGTGEESAAEVSWWVPWLERLRMRAWAVFEADVLE